MLLGAVYTADALYNHRYALGLALALLQTLPLAARRARPLGVLALVTAGALGTAFAYGQVIPLAPAVAGYAIGAHASGRRSTWAAAAAFGAMVVACVRAADCASLALFGAAWVLGDNLRTRRAYLDELEEKAERLEREREANIQRAAAEEKARISRERHDVIAHNVSVKAIESRFRTRSISPRIGSCRKLTNTLKHASARRAWVDVRYGEDDVGVSIRDDGIGVTESNGTSGRGLVGMRERVELFGGQLDVGPVDGGYSVSARFPIGRRA